MGSYYFQINIYKNKAVNSAIKATESKKGAKAPYSLCYASIFL